MAVSKKIISKKLALESNLSAKESEIFLNNFINLIKKNSKTNIVKLHKFGTFFFKTTIARVGRNPKTKELYRINSFRKLQFKPSNNLKNLINWYNLC